MVRASGMMVGSDLIVLPPRSRRRKRPTFLGALALPSILPLFYHTLVSIDILLKVRQELCKVKGISLEEGVKKASYSESLQHG